MQLDFNDESAAAAGISPQGEAATGSSRPQEVVLDDKGYVEHYGSQGSYCAPSVKHERSLVPLIVGQIFRDWYFYVLCAVACALSLYKVYQVQETRTLTASLNEVALQNDAISNQWLGLLSEKEELERQSVIRDAAVNRLHMVQPRTEAEIVIRLDR